MLRKSFSLPVIGTVVFLLALFVVADASQAQAESAGQLQYWVTIEGDVASVRAQQGDLKQGPAAIFELSPATGRWQPLEQAERGSSSASATRTLGYAMALDGDYAIVGAPWHDGFAGAAYIYKRKGDGWGEPQKLSPSDLGRFDHFGSSVSISGDYAVVGATWQNLFGGAVYVFKRVGSEWILQEKLTAGEAKPDEQFGYRVRIDESDIIISGASAGFQDAPTGLAYRFRRSGDSWAEEQKVALSALEGSGAHAGELLIESETSSDVLVLAESLSRDTGLPPFLAPTAPPPPATVIATDGAFEDHTEIVWSSVDLDAIIYRIERNGTLLTVASSEDSLYSDDTGDRGVEYEYCVIVVDMAGDSSAAACDSGSYVVFPPESVSGSEGDFDQFVRLTWTDASSVEVGYLIKREGTEIGTTEADAEVYEDSMAVPVTFYSYEVIAFDADSVQSAPVQVYGVRNVILPPLDVSASDGEYPDFVRITWTDQAENELAYLIIRDEGELLDSIGPGTGAMFYDDTTAIMGWEYDYCVFTQDSSGDASWYYWSCDRGGRGILPAPENVVATDSAFDTHVEITWTDPSDLEDGFEIQRDGTPIDTLDADSTFYTDFGATPGTVHEYCVVAFSDSGGRSDSVCDNGVHAIVVAPSEVQATDGEREDRVDVTWSSTATTAVLFKIYRDTDFIKSVGVNTRSHTDYGGTAGYEHAYTVSAVTALAVESPSEPDTGSRVLRAPAQVAATDDEPEEKIVVSWADNSRLENGYFLTRENTVTSAVDSFWLAANRTSYTDWTAVPGVIYDYTVAAFDSLGDAVGFSESEADFGRRVLLPPSNVAAGDGEFETQVELFWVDNSGAEDGYYIYRDSVLIDSTDDNFTSYVDTSPPGVQASEYGVAAFDAYGQSETASDSGSTTILAPGSFNASDTYTDRVELSWVDLSEIEDKYIITRNGAALDSVGADNSSFTDNTASAGVTYEYCVRAVKSGQSSEEACDDGTRFSPTLLISEVDVKLLASDGVGQDYFGWSVAIDGDVAIVGAYGDSSSRGSAYILERAADGTWTEAQRLLASDRAPSDYFGWSVAISGDYAIVGANGNDDNGNLSGSAYIFERAADGTWPATQTKKLRASDGAEFDYFGWSVAISGDYAIVGASEDNADSGSAYIFERAGGTWPATETKKLTASDGAGGDLFGWSVAISGGTALIGAHKDDDQGPNSGSAYIFERAGTWPATETQKLRASDGAGGDLFGFSVGISGGVALVGARDDDGDRGSAYIFERSGTWPGNETQKLVASDRALSDRFGQAVAISGGTALIGAHWDNDQGNNSGSAYIFERGGGAWDSTETQKLVASDGVGLDLFGYSVAISDGVALVGAPNNDDLGSASGSAYIWPPGIVVASDGNLSSRVRVEWSHHSLGEEGFHVYRDGELLATLAPDVNSYEDFEAQPGRTYEYGVAAFSQATGDGQLFSDFGWRPPNGNITGRIATPTGAGVDGISVDLDPQPTRSLLLDGTGGHVSIPDLHETFDFATDSSYTVEAWIKYRGNGGPGSDDKGIIAKAATLPFPFILGSARAGGNPGRVYFGMGDDGGSIAMTSSARNDLNDDTWHHVACVHDAAQNKLRIYVDGTLEGSYTYASLGDISNTDDLTLGISAYGAFGHFRGQIDEVRIWSVARDSSNIQADMNLQLEGDEEGLVGYWPLDGGNSAAITDLTDGNHYGTFRDGVYWADNAAPIDISGTTDLEGNYSIDRIRYGQETTFEVQPYEGDRQFSPAFKTITLSTEHPVENQVDFMETSSFTVSGLVAFPGTSCGAQNVQIHVDGLLSTLTDKNGKYAVAVSHGEHWIKPVLDGRTFDPDSVQLSVEGDLPGVDFSDITTRTLSGLVGGGCRNPIGTVTIVARSENDCMVDTLIRDTGIFTDYEIALPPQKYLVSASVSSIPAGMDVVDILKFFDNLGDRVVDLTGADSTLDFVYRAPLVVTIEGLDEYISACDPLTFGGEDLPDSLPVIPQGTSLSLTINVNENYGPGKLCALDSGTVTIFDEIFDQQDTPIELVVEDGVAQYTTFASTPSLIAGRVDSKGNNRSFQKALQARVAVEGRTAVTETEWVLVTGHVAPEGADFVTASCTEFLSYILRDPPGDNSYAFLEEGESVRTRIDYEQFSVTDQLGVKFSARFGITLGTWVGIGAGTWTEIEAKAGFETETMAGHMLNRESGTDVTITTTETFSTSPHELLAGEAGDVYIGTGFNFIFAEVGVVEVEDCQVIRSTSVGFEPDSTATTYAYAQQYIQDVLIPEFDSKATHYENLGHPDSAAMFRARQENWEDILAYNDSLKQEAVFKINRSFSAGADFAYSHQTDTTKFSTESHGFVGDFSGDFGKFSFGSAATDFGLSFPVSVHTEYVPDMTETEATRSLTVGYVLTDGDIGDHFTVDIKEDDVYPSPVFDVLAGVSSCPYEPWPDSGGTARMMPRDKATLLTDAYTLDDVPPEEPAVFALTLANESPTQETREYVLREITTSNPHGAIINANGAPLSQGVSYFISGDPLNNSNEVTLTVERGPTKYSYPRLALMLYPPCEYDLWEEGGALQRSDTLYVDVNFDAPCSDIALYLPAPGWTFNKAQQDAGDSVTLILTDYEIFPNPSDSSDSVEALFGQYRRLGTGLEGPGVWENIAAGTPGATSTIIGWFPPPALSDGVYELRAYTKCKDGRGYSNVSVGTIDRSAPLVLGAPEPTDDELSAGEEISITFNELIDCGSINADSVLRYLDGPHAGETIEVDWVCDGTTIVFTPSAGVDPDDLEGRELEARVEGVRDLVGNPMDSAEIWSFMVRQSVFTWNLKSITEDVAFRAPGSISADLVNGSDSTANFTIPFTPSWIAGVSPQTGSIAPGGRQSINFTIQETLAMGDYRGLLIAQSGQGKAILAIYLTVSCHEPVWELDPGRYEHSMTIVTELDIESAISTDSNDRVAAFVGNQLRGVANVDPAADMLYLTVGSNRTWGETVRFQVWDASDCRLYNSTLERFAFVSDDRIGSPENPVMLTATDVLADTVQVIPLGLGWSWFSTYVHGIDMSVDGVLSDLAPSTGDLVKSDAEFATFDPDMGWVGTLTLLDNVSSYMIKLSEAGAILHEGSIINPDSTPVPVDDGWNWIGYLPIDPMAVDTALQDLNPVLSEGDMVKSQTAFAQCDLLLEWLGSLDLMDAGMGYKLYLDSVPPAYSFNYPNFRGKAPGLPWAGNPEQGTNLKVETAEADPGWSVNRRAYQYNMTVIAALSVEGNQCRNEEVVIGAFVDGECRGMAQPHYLSAANPYVAFLMIHSNSVAGERVEFQAFVPEARAVYNVAEAISYEADGAVGTLREPLILSTKGIAFEVTEENVPATFSLSQNYPNPFNPMTTIEYGLPERLHVTVEVFNVLGRRVKTLVDAVQPTGRHSIVWDGKDAQGKDVASGIYFYRLEAGEFTESKRMVILK